MRRERWTCPGCEKVYSVPDSTDLVLCPKCSTVEPEMAMVKKTKPKSSWSASDFAFVGVASVFVLVCGSLLALQLWKVVPLPDADKQLVHTWLKENTQDGSWDEVKWYPPKSFSGLYDFNRLHLIEGIQKAKAAYEKGLGKIEHKEECQKQYDKFCEAAPRVYCSMKYRVSTLNGQGKLLNQQVWELVDNRAVPLLNSNICEVPFSLADKSIPETRHCYDGWKLFDDKDYDPFPFELIRDLDSKFQEAMIWKEPAPIKPRVEPTPQPTPPKPVVAVAPVKPPEPPKDTIPIQIREYLDRVAELKSAELSKLEKRLATYDTRRKSAKGMNEIRAIDERTKQTQAEIDEIKKRKLASFAAPLMATPNVGDVGMLQVIEVTDIVDEETVVVRWHANGKSRLPKVTVAVHPIDTTGLKVGDTSIQAEFVKVTSTKDDSGDLIKRLNDAGMKIEIAVEPAEKDDLEDWQGKYEIEKEKEKKAKK